MADMACPYLRRTVRYAPAVVGTTETHHIFNVEPNMVVVGMFIRVNVAADGNGTLIVGDSGSTNRFMTTGDATISATGTKSGTGAAFATTPGYFYVSGTSITNIDVVYTSTTDTVFQADITMIYFYPFR